MHRDCKVESWMVSVLLALFLTDQPVIGSASLLLEDVPG